MASFFRAFRFPEVGGVSFPDPFRRLSVPPLAGLEGQGCGDLGCRGAAAGLLSALPQHSSSSIVPIPMPSSSPISITGAALVEVTLGLLAKGALELAPLPSPAFYSHLFVVWKTSGSWRPVIDLSHLNRFVDVSHFQMETIQSVLLSVVRRTGWPPSISRKRIFRCRFILLLVTFFASCSVARSTSSKLCALASPRLRRSSPGSWLLFQIYSSGYPYASIPRRLAGPVFLSGVSPRGSADCPPTLSRIGDCHQPPEVEPHTFPGNSVSGGRHRLHLFQGFSVGGTHLTAALNSRRVSVLHLAYRELVAVASRRSFFAGSPRSWRQTEVAVPPALPPSFFEPSGSGGSSVGVDGVSSRSPVVAPSPSSISRSVSPPGVSRPTLLVRRLGRGMGCPSRLSGRFRPVGHPTGSVVYQRQGTARCSAGAFPVPVSSPRSHGGCLLRQHHSSGLPSQGGWHQVSSPQHLGSGDLALDGVPLYTPGSTVPSGLQHVLADALSRPHQLPHTEWSLNMTVFLYLRRLWPVQIVLFATSANHRCSIYFSHFRDPVSACTDAFLQSWEGLQAYAFPPVAIIPRVLATLRASTGTELTLLAPHWAQRLWFSDLVQLSLAPPVILPSRPDLLRLPRSRHLYPDLRRLRLHAWRLSSDLPEPLASPPL